MNYLLAINWSSLFANIGQFILAFSILVTLHELGHFLPAKWFGCRVDKFYLFFDPWFSLWKKKIGETEYGLGWLPMGGYVKISGMIDESMDKETMNQPPKPWEFRSKPAWQRLIIMIGGVVVNFILALVLFAMILFVWGKELMPVKNLKYGLAADSLATTIGLRDGDLITAVNGRPLVYLDELPKQLVLNERPRLTINRNGKDTAIQIPTGFLSKLTRSQRKGFMTTRFPVVVDSVTDKVQYTSGTLQKDDSILAVNGQQVRFFNEFDKVKRGFAGQPVTLTVLRHSDTANVGVMVKEDGSIGFMPRHPSRILQSEKIDYSFLEAIPAGISHGMEVLKDNLTGMRLLFTSKEHKVSDNLGGILSIGQTFGGRWDWQHFWTMTAMFSIILAFMNILPIPALDGGHALFTLYEMISGRKPGDKFIEYAQMVGMVLLLGLMLYALGLDIWRLFR